MIIQQTFESYNTEQNQIVFTDINIIFADIKLLKCKYDNLSIDISINNLVGLSKLIYMNKIESLIEKSNKFNVRMFKRTLILIKAWCFYEGFVLGSNIGLMASYAVEVLVIYLFNNFSNNFTSEIEAFFTFFKMMKNLDWDKNILHLYGIISNDDYNEKIKNFENLAQDFYTDKNDVNNKDKFLINYNEVSNYSKIFEKVKDIDKTQNFNSNKKIMQIKYFNIIDPIFNSNNLGKSVNFHNFSKIKKVIEFSNKDIDNIILSRNNNNPYKYLNSLLKLFSKTLTSNFSEIFFYHLPQPKIVINPYNNADEQLSKNSSNIYKKDINISNNFSSLNESMVRGFNKLYMKKNENTPSQFLNYLEESKHSNFNQTSDGAYVTKDIIDYFTQGLDNILRGNKTYEYKNYYENSYIEEVLKKL